MTVGEIKSELTLMLGNVLKNTGQPFVSPTDLRFLWITRAANKIPRLVAKAGLDIGSIFQELNARWQGTTIDTQPYVARPDNSLLIRTFHSFDKTPAVQDADDERFVPRYSATDFGLTVPATAVPGFPQHWAPVGRRLEISPTPTAAFVTDYALYGLKRDLTFNDDAQTPSLDSDWHEAILMEAARIGAVELGYWERAKAYKAEVLDLIEARVDVPIQEEIYSDVDFDLDGLMTQDEVYA